MNTTSTEVLTVERVFNAPIEKVWEALTDKNQMNNGILIWLRSKLKLVLNFSLKEKRTTEFICTCAK